MAMTRLLYFSVIFMWTCAHKQRPNPMHHAKFFGTYVPKWLQDLGFDAQACGADWIDGYKLRMIKHKIQEKANDPMEAYAMFDADGSGSMTRMEIVESLFRIGIWLTQSEISLLMGALDKDGGGCIEAPELVSFWESYSFD